MNLRRLGSIVVKELLQLRRDRLTFAMIVGIPTMQLVLFGYAINLDVRHLDAAVLDQAHTAHSRELVAQLGATDVLRFKHVVQSPQEIDALLDAGKISAALVLPSDFEARLQVRDRPAAQIIVDGSDQVIQSAARQLAAFPVYDSRGWTSRVQPIEVVNFYNPQRLAPVNTVPGLIGVILTMTLVLFTAIALVRERGNLEMLIATPVSPWELTIGKVLPFVAIGLLQVTIVLGVGKLLFDVPVRGSLAELYAAALVFIVASLSLG
ncbi:MAG TPA: ABC transporter permease, partial [Gammaproteobacteria bacterium]|nr:ABC transporter permease [Gammaproteobacteria bacterium]